MNGMDPGGAVAIYAAFNPNIERITIAIPVAKPAKNPLTPLSTQFSPFKKFMTASDVAPRIAGTIKVEIYAVNVSCPSTTNHHNKSCATVKE